MDMIEETRKLFTEQQLRSVRKAEGPNQVAAIADADTHLAADIAAIGAADDGNAAGSADQFEQDLQILP